jgi:hypothetical protein
MASELDDPTQRPLTLQSPRGGVDPLAVISVVAAAAGIVTLVAGIPTWLPLLLVSIGLFIGMVSLLRSQKSAARWVGTLGTAASVVGFLLFFFYITT